MWNCWCIASSKKIYNAYMAFSYNIWPHCAPSGTQEDDHEHNWRWQDEAAPGPDSPPEVSNYSNFLWYDNFFMCRQTCIITDVGSFLALSNISKHIGWLLNEWVEVSKIKDRPWWYWQIVWTDQICFHLLKGSIGSSTENSCCYGLFYSGKPKMIVIGFMHFVSLNISCTNLINPNENISCHILV